MLRMITYRKHECPTKHRTRRTLAKCLWPYAYSVEGEGDFATLSSCRHNVLLIVLHSTEQKARQALDLIAGSGCGGACHLGRAEANGKHRLIRLEIQ